MNILVNARLRNTVCLLFLCGLGVGCAHSDVSLDKFAATMPDHSATQPDHRMDRDWWEDRHAGVLSRIAETDPDLILIGDSITHGWDNNMDIWNAHFGAYAMVNMGFGGDRTQHVLWRLENGEIDGITPDLAIIMIGTNNSNREDNTAQEIGDGIAAICVKLRAELPETELLILAIFPRGEGPSAQREKNAEASRIVERIARSDSHIHYLNFNHAFLAPGEILPKEIMPDLLHPNDAGYEIWASEIEGKVHRLMQR